MMTTHYKFDLFGFYDGTTTTAAARSTTVAPPDDLGFKYNWNGRDWVTLPLNHPVPVFANAGVQPVPVADPTEWLIDIGSLFDRFGSAKMAILASPDANVQAFIKDLTVRKWGDLQSPEMIGGVGALKQMGFIDDDLESAILTNPVLPDENLALRKTYFS